MITIKVIAPCIVGVSYLMDSLVSTIYVKVVIHGIVFSYLRSILLGLLYMALAPHKACVP